MFVAIGAKVFPRVSIIWNFFSSAHRLHNVCRHRCGILCWEKQFSECFGFINIIIIIIRCFARRNRTIMWSSLGLWRLFLNRVSRTLHSMIPLCMLHVNMRSWCVHEGWSEERNCPPVHRWHLLPINFFLSNIYVIVRNVPRVTLLCISKHIRQSNTRLQLLVYKPGIRFQCPCDKVTVILHTLLQGENYHNVLSTLLQKCQWFSLPFFLTIFTSLPPPIFFLLSPTHLASPMLERAWTHEAIHVLVYQVNIGPSAGYCPLCYRLTHAPCYSINADVVQPVNRLRHGLGDAATDKPPGLPAVPLAVVLQQCLQWGPRPHLAGQAPTRPIISSINYHSR